MRRAWTAAACALIALAMTAAATAAPPAGKGKGKGNDNASTGVTSAATVFSSLAPGATSVLAETVPVNVVFVGFSPAEVPWVDVLAELPDGAKPVIRSRAFWGIDEQLGLDYTYDYNEFYYDDGSDFAKAFFGYLQTEAAKPENNKPLTLFQQDYNAQQGKAKTVTENRWIGANATEKWLIDNAPDAIDTSMPTIFFVNWFGQADFKHHVYVKTDEPDPDTGTNFGLVRSSRKLVAWGGTTPNDEEDGLGARGVNRVWFYDLSAGPELWGGSWNVDDQDLDGDGVADYRIPAIWDYGKYRPANKLAGDLGKVVRYVGLNLLFTSSPLYPPYFTADRIPSTVDLDSNTVEGWNKVDASETYITPDLFESEVEELPSGFSFSAEYADHDFKGDIKNCYLQWVVGVRCYNDHTDYHPFANIFLNWALNTDRFIDGDADYEAGVINYAVGIPPKGAGLLGFADDNWIDGTQSGVFSFVYPGAVAAGYGLTTTMIHEYGHHSSVSHPHDGYDSETDKDYGPGGDTFFAWLGDESNSMMSYIDLNWDFSQFDHDNSARHHAAGYIQIANRVAAQIPAGNAAAQAQLAAADGQVSIARLALANHDYPGMLAAAKLAYESVRSAATLAGVTVSIRQPSTWTVRPEQKGGVGMRRQPGAIDLDEKANVKRMAP